MNPLNLSTLAEQILCTALREVARADITILQFYDNAEHLLMERGKLLCRHESEAVGIQKASYLHYADACHQAVLKLREGRARYLGRRVPEIMGLPDCEPEPLPRQEGGESSAHR